MATIDLGLVKGADGATGPQGPQGETGATGATGPQGPAGRGLPTGETENQMPIRGASDIEWQDPLVIKNRLGIASISTATDIDTGESLDNLRTVGTYNCETDLIAASLVNAPTAKAFVLVVSYATGTNAMLLQTVIEAESGKRYTRAYTAGTGIWGAWAYDLSVTAATPVLPLDNGGTGASTAQGASYAIRHIQSIENIISSVGAQFSISNQTVKVVNGVIAVVKIEASCTAALNENGRYTVCSVNQGVLPVQGLTAASSNRGSCSFASANSNVIFSPNTALASGQAFEISAVGMLTTPFTI